MQTPYELLNGDTAMVTDTETAGRSLGRAVELWRDGATEPLIYGSAGKPEGVVISFEQWSEYETLKEDADDDRRRYEGVRRRLANLDPAKLVSFEDAAREDGWDLDVPPGPADDPDRRQ